MMITDKRTSPESPTANLSATFSSPAITIARIPVAGIILQLTLENCSELFPAASGANTSSLANATPPAARTSPVVFAIVSDGRQLAQKRKLLDTVSQDQRNHYGNGYRSKRLLIHELSFLASNESVTILRRSSEPVSKREECNRTAEGPAKAEKSINLSIEILKP